MRNIEREKKRLETEEKKMKTEIKKMATNNQHVRFIPFKAISLVL